MVFCFGCSFAGDTIDLKKDPLSNSFKLSRDVEITLNSMVKFRCKLLYLDSSKCIVNYHTGVKPKNVVSGPEIANHSDTSLGKSIFMIPLSEIKIISFWKIRSDFLAELPLGLFSFTLPLAAVAGLANGFGTPVLAIVIASAAGIVLGVILNKKRKYFVENGQLIRLRKGFVHRSY